MADLALLSDPATSSRSQHLGAGKTAAARAMIRYLAGDDALEVPSPDLYAGAKLRSAVSESFTPTSTASTIRASWRKSAVAIARGTLALIEWRSAQPMRCRMTASISPSAIVRHSDPMRGRPRLAVRQGCCHPSKGCARCVSFLDAAGHAGSKRERMPGDASTRSYRGYPRRRRLHPDERAQTAGRPAIYDGKPYSAACISPRTSKPFVAMCNGLRTRGFSAAIHHADLDAGFLVTEDFGTAGVSEGDPPRPIAARYEAATELLATLHREPLPATLPLTATAHLCHSGLRHRCPADRGQPDAGLVSAGSRRRGDQRSPCRIQHDVARSPGRARRSAEDLGAARLSFPNLIWARRTPGIARLGIIDFQDTVLGSAAYDLASLLQDARIDVPEQLELALLTQYIKARRAADDGFDPAVFAEFYAIMSAQRNTKLLGIFARLNRRDGKPQYLAPPARIWTYLTRSLAHPALSRIRQWYAANVRRRLPDLPLV